MLPQLGVTALEFIANAVSVLIVDAIAVAIKIRLRIVAIPRIGRRCT